MPRLTRGTVEYVPADLADRTGVVTDLSSASPTFDVVDDDDVYWYQDESASATGMRINCLMDTSSAHSLGLWPIGHYRWFVGFTVGSEVVKLGPVDLYIIDGGVVT